jgi:RNA-binding protein
MIALTSKQRRELRAQAHVLHPVVSVGQHGVTPHVMHEIDVALRAHGLVKVRVFSEDRAQRETMLALIADELDAAPVQHLGKVLILWRPLEEKPAKPAARPAKKKPKERARAGSKRPTTERMTREARVPHSAGRRARGAASAADDRTGPDSHRRPRTVTTKRRPDEATQTPVARRRPSSSLQAVRAPTGKSAPNPRRRRRAG